MNPAIVRTMVRTIYRKIKKLARDSTINDIPENAGMKDPSKMPTIFSERDSVFSVVSSSFCMAAILVHMSLLGASFSCIRLI